MDLFIPLVDYHYTKGNNFYYWASSLCMYLILRFNPSEYYNTFFVSGESHSQRSPATGLNMNSNTDEVLSRKTAALPNESLVSVWLRWHFGKIAALPPSTSHPLICFKKTARCSRHTLSWVCKRGLGKLKKLLFKVSIATFGGKRNEKKKQLFRTHETFSALTLGRPKERHNPWQHTMQDLEF